MHYCIYHSPVGTMTLVSDGKNLLQSNFCLPPVDAEFHPEDPVLISAVCWLKQYFAGEKPNPLDLPIQLTGTPFQKAVWNILLTIPYGQATTYGVIARQFSRKMSAQAVGGAVGNNPLCIIIPCHRVLGAGHRLTGYSAGIEKKISLLDFEKISFC